MSLSVQEISQYNEDSYVEIPNHIIDKLLQYHFNGLQFSILLLLITERFEDKHENDLSVESIAQRIGSKTLIEITIDKNLQELIERKIIVETQKDTLNQSAQYTFNVNTRDWKGE